MARSIFGDTTPSNNWTVSAGTPVGILTLDVSTGPAIVNVVNQTATISAVVAGNDGITKNGAGTLTLSGANTFTGGLNISARAVRLSTAGAAGGVGGGPITINPGTILVGATNTNFTTPIILAGGTLGSANTTGATFSGGINVTANSTVYAADPQTLTQSGDDLVTGTLNGSGNINLLPVNNNTNPDGNQALRLRGTAASNYSGTITMNNNTKFELQTTVAGPFSPGGTGTIVMTAGVASLGNTTNGPAPEDIPKSMFATIPPAAPPSATIFKSSAQV